jgi:cyclic beta-1,2-glucan synthetase
MSVVVSVPTEGKSGYAEPPLSPLIAPLSDAPIRAQLLGGEGLEDLARRLATACRLAPPKKASSPLLKRFEDNARVLRAAHRRILDEQDTREGRGLDADWLADNFHIVEEALREIRRDLPAGYDEELPKLATAVAAGYPRVHAIALALLAHTDSELDQHRLDRFVTAFHEVTALTIGELWAFPTMLRLVLVENLRRLARQMLLAWDARDEAERWSGSVGTPEPPAELPPTAEFSDPFVVRLIQLWRDQGARAGTVLSELEARLAALGDDANGVLRREHRRQAANQVSVSNCVIGLRLLASFDWNAFFERHSAVDAVLRSDPAGVYAHQDFATRDRYRQVIERMARGSRFDECDVAHRAVALAHAALRSSKAANERKAHVGYYLVDDGRALLRHELRFHPEWREAIYDWIRDHPRTFYFGLLSVAWVAAVAAFSVWGTSGAAPGGWLLALVVLALWIPASELAVGLVHHLLTLCLPPRALPKLDFREEIAAGCETFVVMPSMLVRPESAELLFERLEIHYLANPDSRLRFALLTDFADAPAEHMPEDRDYLDRALAALKELNQRHSAGGADRFVLLHRRRVWNPVQGCWMGWERKRGKLSEFNRLLRGAHDTSYEVLSADVAEFRRIRYVITLDADTQLPRDSARRLVGTIAHPLNQAVVDANSGRVTLGYGVLQPRVSYHMLAAARSRFAGLLAVSAGIDPYATAVSDVYMDLFGIGSFTGKGIYDVDAFEATAGHAFPDNRILSHDLIEGNFARCGLATDIELFDDFPPAYHAYARREHRWVRGDWQLLPWLGKRVPTPAGSEPNPLPLVERWKLLDNLRRSLVPPALVVFLVLAWTLLPGSPIVWTIAAMLVCCVPILQLVVGSTLTAVRARTVSPFASWRDVMPATVGQSLLSICFLADQARLLIDAIARTLARLFITRRHLLDWETAASTERRLGTAFRDFALLMWPAPATSALVLVLIAVVRPEALWAAIPVLAAWFVSPAVACWMSQPKAPTDDPLTTAEVNELRLVARRIWLFFETFVGEQDHWLPPDNYQESPFGKVAHRTSPTNQGLLLLSTVAAHDLGYVGPETLLARLEKTFDTFDRMERHRGHFYNWYDTHTLRPLMPLYVSTVDSGNLLACLVTLKQALREFEDETVPSGRWLLGLRDTVMLTEEAWSEAHGHSGRRDADVVAQTFERLLALCESDPEDLRAWHSLLQEFESAASALVRAMHASPPAGEHVETWLKAMERQVHERREELATVAPWIAGDGATGGNGDPEHLARQWLAPVRLAQVRSPVAPASAAVSAQDGLAAPEHAGAPEAIAELPSSKAPEWVHRARRLIERCDQFMAEMDFRFLYQSDRELFAIGSNISAGRLDGACYDLLASESCLSSLLAVGRGDAPRRHWFQLSRPFIRVAGRVGLMSWGGTMFEYLMPRLLLKCLPGTLLNQAQRAAVARQIEYGHEQGLPWGVSESGFAARYVDGDYQYQSFGVPGLGLKRGLELDSVVAPYASLLAAQIAPRETLENLRRLRAEGAEGLYGFYEAIDYTKDRVPKGSHAVLVESYMAHHQGMGLIALVNAIAGEPMPRRFHAEPMVRAVELLLQERVPRDAPVVAAGESSAAAQKTAREESPLLRRRINSPVTPAPRTHLLSNGHYHVMVTNSGSGYSRYQDLDVTRWREDRTREGYGHFVYVRDLGLDLLWSVGHHPICRPVEDFEATFAADKAIFRRVDAGIETQVEVTVSPERPAEVRRLTLTNRSQRPRELELTSYAEIVLASHGSDLAHPAFGKLFLQTEWLPGPQALICSRRPRSSDQKRVSLVYVAALESGVMAESQFESDRAQFIGRGRSLANPAALVVGATLSCATGPVLDPIVSLRHRVRLAAGASASLSYTTAIAETREEAVALADHFREPTAIIRAFELAWAQSVVEHRQRNWSSENVHLYQRLGANIVFAGTLLRAESTAIAANTQGQTALWRYGISGDNPIVLARLAQPEEMSLARQAVSAHAFLRLKGLVFDLVLLDEQTEGYREDLMQSLSDLVRSSEFHDLIDKPGGLFVRRAKPMPPEDFTLLLAASRVVLCGDRGTLEGQLDRLEPARPELPPFRARSVAASHQDAPLRLADDLVFANGFGGFTSDGREYHLLVALDGVCGHADEPAANAGVGLAQCPPPAPWINVVANPACGFLVSELGSGFSWTENSQSNRLTPWSNDPVCDPPGEVVYLRDEDTGEVWSATPLPIADRAPTLVRHGQGYSVFERHRHGLEHELTMFVPPDDALKIIRLHVRNVSRSRRRLSATFFAEWVLGTVRDQAAMNVSTDVDEHTGALIARNAFRSDFATRLAFAHGAAGPRAFTADRAEFLGRHGTLASPAAMSRAALSGRVGAGFDPCAAIRSSFEVEPGGDVDVVFLMGEADDIETARDWIRRYEDPARVQAALDEVRAAWDRVLSAIEVRTPSASMDLMLNRWLVYQVRSCRLWARSAFYQSGGAYGFRDQLQDVMALVYGAPEDARAQLLRAASRQFVEGDVQHWWHPPQGRGVRTRFSDDLLWLALVACHYAEVTDDHGVLDEVVPFITGPILGEHQEEDYGLPQTAFESRPLYDHCVRALKRGYQLGEHGLPLMGTGDWNDGMNKVGAAGKGESVWDAWFLITILNRFAPLADARGDSERATWCRESAESLRAAVEAHAWDGAWYRRAYFDDGTPLGSAQNDECQIDAIAQTWAVISGVAQPERARQAMAAVEERLVRRSDGLILLFTPPFDHGTLQPGYIKGYVPGIRENGGQYTHAATWVALAEALMGRGSEAFALFDMLNPISHAETSEAVARYKVEPYVIAADIYGQPPHTGRGGWTWYTGSASWFYRVGVESMLGFKLQGDRLRIDPCIPADWKRFEITYRRGKSVYKIEVENPDGRERGVRETFVDGHVVPEGWIELVDDGGSHSVRVVMG